MSPRRRGARRAARLVVSVALTLGTGAGLVGCGDDREAEQAKLASAYASRVAQVTAATSRELAATSDGANYRDADSAAATTRQYAEAIRIAADRLVGAEPPERVAGQHRELVALYRATADRLGALSQQFAATPAEGQLARLAQVLSGEVQTYSTREAQLRGAIDRALAGARRSTPGPQAPTSTPADG